MKNLLIILSAVLVLAGCIKNQPNSSVGAGKEQEITFETPVLSRAVKSVYEVASFLTEPDFRVWAYYYNEAAGQPVVTNDTFYHEYMNAVQVTCQEKVWKAVGDKKYFWPIEGGLSFVAFSPSSPSSAPAYDVTPSGLSLTGYVAPGDEDLMISQISNNSTKPGEGAATLIFEHALSSIVFKIRSGIYGDRTDNNPERVDTDLRVTKIEIVKAFNTGNAFRSIDWTDPEKGNIGWEVGKTVADYVAYDKTVAKTDTDGFVLNGDYVAIHDKVEVPAGKSLTNLILLPQALSGATILRITYDMRHSDMADGVWVEDEVVEAQMNTLGITEWLAGKRYTYNISLTREKISCTVDTVQWSDETHWNEEVFYIYNTTIGDLTPDTDISWTTGNNQE